MIPAIDPSKRTLGLTFNNGLANLLVWAPYASAVTVLVNDFFRIELNSIEHGYWTLETDAIKPEMTYLLEISSEQNTLVRADPASLALKGGVHGKSIAVNLKNEIGANKRWTNLPLSDYIIYELHIGTFTPEGTFFSAIEKLDHLLDLGITAVEIMPISSFPGERNWGYDGVFPFAVQGSYGGHEGLTQFVNACHERSIAVILDVVYNHFGPEGNYFSDFGPYFTDKHHTPWGKAINFDDAHADAVRHFFIENALFWLRDFEIDALRLDAVHAIKDFSARPFLAELSDAVSQLNVLKGKVHYLMAECDLNDPKFLAATKDGGMGMNAQWLDEFHHALRVAAGQERSGYYHEFDGLNHLAKSYRDTYVYDGCYSPGRRMSFGASARQNTGAQFIVFSQNHDQIGNRALGERSAQLYSLSLCKLLAAAVLVAPYLPLLFMGEEFGETNPFLYFVSHSESALIEAVRKGRAKEFEGFHQANPPDPQDKESFEKSKLNWEISNKALFNFYKKLIALRKNLDALGRPDRNSIRVNLLEPKKCLVLERWSANEKLLILLNFNTKAQEIDITDAKKWKLMLNSESEEFGGRENYSSNLSNEKLIIESETAHIYIKENV